MTHQVEAPRSPDDAGAPRDPPDGAARTGRGTSDGADGNGHRHVTLIRPLDNGVWLADSDGLLVDARRAAPASGPDDPTRIPTSAEALPILTALKAAELAKVIDVASDPDGPSWLLSEHIDGIPIRRLLAVATLTPSQAAYIAVHVLEGLLAMHQAGVMHGRLTARNVLIDPNGDVHLTDWALAALSTTNPSDSAVAQDIESARALVADLARNANRPVVWSHTRDEAVRSCLEHCGNGGSRAGLASMAQQLRSVLEPATESEGVLNVRGELAMLVRALDRRLSHDGKDAPSIQTAPATRATTATTATEPATTTQHRPPALAAPAFVATDEDDDRISWQHPLRVPTTRFLGRTLSPIASGRRMRRRLVAIAAAALLVMLAGAFTVTRPSGTSLLDSLLHRNGHPTTKTQPKTGTPAKTPSGTSAKASTARIPRAVPALAPASAGNISGIELRALSTCSARKACPVRMTVRFQPAYNGEQVVWRIASFNRCNGKTAVIGRGTVSGEPASFVFDSTTVTVPSATSQALVALVDSPARAASAPLLVPTGGGHC